MDEWKQLIWDAVAQDAICYSGIRKIIPDVSFHATSLDYPLDYTDISYTRAKGRQLERNYWDVDEIQRAFDTLAKRRDKPHSSVSITLKNHKKDSRSQGFCMQSMIITTTPEYSSIDVYYRSTELILKFLADLVFFSRKLTPLLREAGITPSIYRFRFANAYISAMYLPIFLRYESHHLEFFKHVQAHDAKFHRTCLLAARRNLEEDCPYTYKQRVKMWEYFKEHVDPKQVEKACSKL